ncbi:ABC transporter permease [Bacteroidetes/Chlorobi group bacterium Naka2016]|jgi:phospholipid/cholesterol/gamma-HCH transport system permease protein|nr:MAG: ABC transporter permease [Bacteroidetes/Chlorobi group bacterium Naka2016]
MLEKFFSYLGKKIIAFLQEFGAVIYLLAKVVGYLPRIVKDWKLVVYQMAIVGSDSLPLVILIGSFTGAITALQATSLFTKFNFIEIARPFIGSSIATSVFTELSPVLTALVIAGRVGGAMAAQIGAMKISEQIDALEIMAIDKDRFLAMPRVVAFFLMMPVLTIFSNLVALLGGLVLVIVKYDFTSYMFFDSIQRFFRASEVMLGLSKSMVFGTVSALISCYCGFNTKGGAEGVGNSTVRAYTISASCILIIDALFGLVF